MHMTDALLSPATGAAMWLASAGALAFSARHLRSAPRRAVGDDSRGALMGALGAFVFAAQMINFAIPGTGGSGHLGGGLLLAMLLGPHAALIVIASVLAVQATVFADGGLLALGANIFNLGVLPCLVVYPLLNRWLTRRAGTEGQRAAATMIAAIAGLQLGAFGVVVQTAASGISDLPLLAFAGLMLPIHLAVGLVEGAITIAVVRWVERAQPELLPLSADTTETRPTSAHRVVFTALVAAVLIGGASWFASERPDGLEWSIAQVAIAPIETPAHALHQSLAEAQRRIALLPDYNFAFEPTRAGASLAGMVGGAITLVLVAAIAVGLRRRD